MKQLLVINESARGEIEAEYATIFDVCEWWIQTYPEDVFPGDSGKGTSSVANIRELCKAILAMRKKEETGAKW